MAHPCSACMASLEPEDGHDRCPSCLGLEHLREGLMQDACMNCSCMPWALRAARVAEVECLAAANGHLSLSHLPPGQFGRSRRPEGAMATGSPPNRLSSKVDRLAADMDMMKSLLLALQPGAGIGAAGLPPAPPSVAAPLHEDAMSLAALANLFNEEVEDEAPLTSGEASHSSAQGSLQGVEDASMAAIIRAALAHLQLPVPQADAAQASAFFRRSPTPVPLTVPPSEEYLRELHACWRDTKTLSRFSSDARTLAAMQDPARVGLGRMPPIEPAIASLILAPDEALRPDARCPLPQCRVTDELLCKAYDAAARMGRIGNSLSHLMLAASAALQQAPAEPSLLGLSDASLQAFWLAQSPLTETCRSVLRGVPVEPGELFGAAALAALERAAQARQTRQQLSGLRRPVPTPSRPRGPSSSRTLPLAFSGGLRRSQRSTQPPPNDFRAPGRQPARQPRAPQPYRRPPRELSVLLAKGAIEPVDPLLQSGGFYSAYFLVSKKVGGFRPVLDLRGINRFLRVLPFHMLTTADTLRVVTQGEWFTTVDLRDAYFHVPIASHHRKFLRFAFQDQHYQFRVLPFGLSLSPRVFTRVVVAALAPLQAQGMKVLPYLDDWLVCAPSRSQVAQDTARLLCHVARLGLTVNTGKSCLVPSQQVTYLGLVLDSVAMRACLTPRRVDDISHLLPIFRLGKNVPYIQFLRLLGRLTAASAVVPLGLLSLRPMQIWLNSLHLDAKWHRHRRVRVSRQCLHSLSRWRNRAYLLMGAPMGAIPSRRETVTVDACLSGWGAVWQGRTVQGLWSAQEGAYHINVLELRAVLLALRHFLPQLTDRHVLVRSDNMSAVSQINHQGGTRSAQLLRVSQSLLSWASPRLASLRAVFLPGDQNQVADFLSRHKPPPGEWRLHPEVVETIWSLFGRAEVDLFASEESRHCPLWFSWAEVTSPMGQDALAHDWPDSLLYAFPPQPLLLQTLQRVLTQGHRLLLVAPRWPGRVWFPLLRSLCCGPPWRLPDRKDLLSQLRGQIWHPDPHRLQLWAWPLRGPTHC
ncbi:uncharacterized protein LOC117483621 [Trematomus bernacchii]|uniref:uncharacterized protein LOC117483621 n=1 Tax=Trematomus bernacchii TaxID=40690 RepID=UPI00146CDED1|nr:uncharacterized protein LOC117483621 [Trematomus bernacchii]